MCKMTEKPKKLTKKQEKFVHEYLKDQNATQAAIRAGYSAKSAESTGSVLFNTPRIRKVIDEKLTEINQKALEEAQVSAQDVVNNFVKIFEATSQPKRITVIDADGNEQVVEVGGMEDPANANRANENLGKIAGVFKADNDQSAGSDNRRPLKNVSDKELEQLEQQLDG